MAKDFNLDDFFDENDVLEAINEISSSRFWRPKLDKTSIRVLPPIKTNGERLFYFTHKVHWINRVPYECLNQTLVDKDGKEHVAEPCPICNLAKQLFKLGEKDKEAQEEAAAISAKRKDVVRILVRDESGSKIHFYEMPISVRNLFITAISSGDFGEPPIHPIKGNDLSLQRTGSGKTTKYDSTYIAPKKTPIAQTKEEIISILKEAEKMPYNSILSFMSYDSLKKVLRDFSGSVSSDEDTSYDEATKETVQPRSTTKKVVGEVSTDSKILEEFSDTKKERVSVVEEEDEKDALDDLLSELNGLADDDDLSF